MKYLLELDVTKASTPKKAAERMMLPKFSGSTCNDKISAELEFCELWKGSYNLI